MTIHVFVCGLEELQSEHADHHLEGGAVVMLKDEDVDIVSEHYHELISRIFCACSGKESICFFVLLDNVLLLLVDLKLPRLLLHKKVFNYTQKLLSLFSIIMYFDLYVEIT